MPFNRYFIEKVDGFLVSHFGFLANSGHLLDAYSCAISRLELENQKKSLLDYLGRSGTLSDPPSPWQPPLTMRQVDLFNFIGLCAGGELAEITLNNLVGKQMAELKHNQSVVNADSIALLRSNYEIQKHWIKDMTA